MYLTEPTDHGEVSTFFWSIVNYSVHNSQLLHASVTLLEYAMTSHCAAECFSEILSHKKMKDLSQNVCLLIAQREIRSLFFLSNLERY